MFNLSGSEVIIILILALVILGPDKLPQAMRKAGRTWGELRKISSGFQEEVRKGFEEPAREVRRTADTVRKAASFPNKKLRYNPLKDEPPPLGDGESVAEPDPVETAASTAPTSATMASGPSDEPTAPEPPAPHDEAGSSASVTSADDPGPPEPPAQAEDAASRT